MKFLLSKIDLLKNSKIIKSKLLLGSRYKFIAGGVSFDLAHGHYANKSTLTISQQSLGTSMHKSDFFRFLMRLHNI